MPTLTRLRDNSARIVGAHRKPRLPIPTSGLAIYATAESIAASYAEAGAVNNWPDLSANGFVAMQGTAGARPTMRKTAGPLGGPVLRFDGVDDYLAFNNPSYPQSCIYFIVAKVTGGGTGDKVILASNDANNQHAVVINATNGEQLGIFDGAVVQSSALGYADDWHLFVHQAKADPDLARVDGTQVISGASGSGASGVIRLGASSTSSNYAPMDLAFFAMYSRGANPMSTAEIQAIEAILLRTYGVNGVEPIQRRYYFGVFSDSPLSVSDPPAFFSGIAAIGLDSAIFTNGSTGRADTLATEADKRGTPVFIGSLEELAANPAADIPTIVKALWRHKSLMAHYVIDEPATTDLTNIMTWVNAYRAADPAREAFPVLIGTDRVDPIYSGAGLKLLVIDVYPFGTANASMDTTMSGFGYAFDMASYIQQVTINRDVLQPLYVILQTHGGGVGLRLPTPAELNLEFWIATSLGANGVFWFIWDTEDFWAGLDNAVGDPNGLRPALLALSGELTADVRAVLRDTVPAVNEWTATSGAVVRTLTIPDSSRQAGPKRYVVVYNPTTSTISTGLAPISGPPRNLTNLRTGTTQAGVATNNYSLAPGHGLLFQTTPATQATGVPDVPIDWTQTPSTRWAAHPLNEPVNGTYMVQTHPVAATLSPGDSIQNAIDGLPLGPASIVLTGTNGHYAGFSIYGRSNLHILAPNGAIIDAPAGTPDYKDNSVKIAPAARWLTATGYADANAGVDAGVADWVAEYRSPPTDIYLQNLTFDGGGVIVAPVNMSCVRRVLYDGCTWQNMLTSAQVTAASNAENGGTGDGLAGFHFGSVDANARVEQVGFRNCTFSGPGRWAIYLDGSHGAVVVGCTFAGSNYSSGIWVALTNDDFSYSDTITAHVATTLDEKRSAMYGIFANNTVTGSVDAILSYSGGCAGIFNNTINSVHIAFGITARGSNKWAPITGLVYYHYGSEFIGNTIATVVAGPENGAQGILNGGASHCGKDNTPASFWDPASGGTRTYWGRIGSGVDPLVPGVTKQLKVQNNVVTSGPAGLVLINPDNVPGEAGPAGTLEGTHAISGNTNNGSPLT